MDFNTIWGMLSVGIFGIVLIVITLIIIRAFGIVKIGKNGISFSKKEKHCDIDNTKISYVVLKIVKITSKIYNIEKSILKCQMNYVEQMLEYLREKDLDCYLTLLLKKEKDKSEEYRDYVNVIYRIYNETKNTFRRFLKENNIENKNGFEWDKYKNQKIKFIISKMNKELDISYSSNYCIDKQTLDDNIEKELSNSIKKSFHDIFDKSKSIYIEKMEEIKKLEKNLDNTGIEIFKKKNELVKQ